MFMLSNLSAKMAQDEINQAINMTILRVLKYPDPFLKTKTKALESVDDETREQIKDMFETMYEETGVGLAATQVGLDKRLFVMDCSSDQSEPVVFINPVITERVEEVEGEEGCLSFPGVYAKITRAKKVTVTALDQDGNEFSKHYSGLEARCVQHELDHLDGVVFFDYLSPVKRKMLEKKMAKVRKKNM